MKSQCTRGSKLSIGSVLGFTNAEPALFEGFARIIGHHKGGSLLGCHGGFGDSHAFCRYLHGEDDGPEADSQAIREIWIEVGADLQWAIDHFDPATTDNA